ncbi:MAG TPA: methyltransferase domain-containing protein [Longimicrobium sp.]|nr:methyltransferase domain-containing protein [Longimicrobium sp.]
METLSVAYYGYVSDTSGYGHTARAYVHALHRAGVELSVVDLTRRRVPPEDELVASLMGRRTSPDVHLFHGIPPQWARLAFPIRNSVGMTVWETDAMPGQWRSALNHVQDVWLPCAHNVEVFGKSLERPVFRLPHPVFPPHANGDTPDPAAFLGIDDDAYLFYALFAWQERKGPRETLDAYLTAFTAADRTVLLLKTDAVSAGTARAEVEAARARHPSGARVELRAETWTDAGVEALHRRGDCYLSLHRGEGWGYPLFEAACRGKPVVATAWSGPLDYLDPAAHALVRCRLAPVRQPYVYYSPRMRWAEPEVAHAVEQLRAVHADREGARARAAAAAVRIRADFSLEAVGAAARGRLEEVLRRAGDVRWPRRPANGGSPETAPPPHPAVFQGAVPVEWYDADYFQTGKKSNWEGGYSWAVFGALFRDTAAYLADAFPEAARYLDAGCATGLLVRALRERGKEAWGVDGSPWAIEHADDLARPWLVRADVAEYQPERACDVVTAFNLLAHLTEAQALAFLARVRPCVGTAIVATIPTVEPGRALPGNRDPSHVTRQTREWWAALFRRAGWRQDPLHRVAERCLGEHPLPRRMGWDVFLFAPDDTAAER